MTSSRGSPPRIGPAEPALRIIMRRLREIMSQAGDGQSRLDKIVRQISGLMIAEVCSLYLKRQDGTLELFATEGLNTEAVHNTHLKRGEGLVGRCAELAKPVNVSDAQAHPAFSHRPETGEEMYHSLLAVPILRSGHVLGVLVVQNKKQRDYSEEDVEVLETTAMVMAEHLVSGEVAGVNSDIEYSRDVSHVVKGQIISEGLALGHVVLHEPRVVVTKLLSDDPDAEIRRLDKGVEALRRTIDEMLGQRELARAGEHRDVLEAYRMFAHDRGWLRRMKEAVNGGLTAEAAVERVQNDTRARMLRQGGTFWRERYRDFDDLSERLMRILTGRMTTASQAGELPDDAIVVARTMGPADLLDYDRSKLRGLIVEDGSGQSHVAIVAKALRIPAIGQSRGIIDRADAGDAIIVDAETGEIHLRPSANIIDAYSDKVRFRAKRQKQYQSLRDVPALTKDGKQISMHINAGLLVDMKHIEESGAEGVGLFRTELQFMVSTALPKLEEQVQAYSSIVESAGDKPIVFRALDIGGDKVLPYMRHNKEQNPALGWRAIRMSFDRSALFRIQVRAMLRACAGRELRLLIPMVADVGEIDTARELVDIEVAREIKHGRLVPGKILLGAMIEVPSVLWHLDGLLPRVDFTSVGSNDLMQYLFAADRTNERVAGRYDGLSISPLRALKSIVEASKRHKTPLSLCGEMAGRPLDAMALIALGFNNISMAPASIGPVKAMILSLNSAKAGTLMDGLLSADVSNVREELLAFARDHDVEL